MADIIAVRCPECGREMKVRAELEGKKIRCKDCEAVFPVKAPPPPKKPAPAKKPPAGPPKRTEDEGEYGNPNPYGVTTVDLTPRCPHCATELDEDAVLCVNCGFNVLTREHLKTTRTVEGTGMEQFLWVLPGILCVLAIVALIGIDLYWCLLLGSHLADSSFDWLGYGGIKVWVVIASLFGIFFAGKFAIKRLLLNFTVPERKK